MRLRRMKTIASIERIEVTIPCPHCGASLNITNIPFNTKVNCSECQGPIKIAMKTDVKLPPILKPLLGKRVDDNDQKPAEAFYAPHSSAPDAKELLADNMNAVCPQCDTTVPLDPSIANTDDLEFKCPCCNKAFGIGKKTKLKLHPLALFQLGKLHSIW